MNDVIGNRWNCEVAYNTNYHKNKISGISRTEKSVSISCYLLQIFFQHILLDFTHDTTKDVDQDRLDLLVRVQ